MKSSLPFALILLLLALVAACSPTQVEVPPTAAALQTLPWLDAVTAVPEPEAAVTAVATPEETTPIIVLPLSIYIVENESGSFNSARDEAEIRQIIERANEIWTQANIQFELRTIERLTLPAAVIAGIQLGEFSLFFDDVGTAFDVPSPSLLNGFYAKEIGGPNGIVPFNSHVFFIADQPSVHDERVTAHEIGHILGLHHVLDNPERLMYSGTNGTALVEEEVTVARYAALGILDRVR